MEHSPDMVRTSVQRQTHPPTAQVAILAFLTVLGYEPTPEPTTGEIIRALATLDVSEEAARATLNRMTHKGLLTKRKSGREVTFQLTPEGRQFQHENFTRVLQRKVLLEYWDDTWTHAFYSLPANSRTLARQLQTALERVGFGRLRKGHWIAPGRVDMHDVLAGLEGSRYVRTFYSTPTGATSSQQVLPEAFNLPAIANVYQEFLTYWRSHRSEMGNALFERLQLYIHWFNVLRQTPVLPAALLRGENLAIQAEKLFRSLDSQLQQAEKGSEPEPAPGS